MVCIFFQGSPPPPPTTNPARDSRLQLATATAMPPAQRPPSHTHTDTHATGIQYSLDWQRERRGRGITGNGIITGGPRRRRRERQLMVCP